MGLLDRLRGGRRESSVSTRYEATAVSVSLLGGQDDLEVVGELAYQDALWRLSGGTLGDRIRRQIVAVLVPEPTNLYDANAIAVQIDGQVVGYLPRATAQEYLPGLQRLMSVRGGYVALRGVIVGGGYYDDGPGRLGSGWNTTLPTSASAQFLRGPRRRDTRVLMASCGPASRRHGSPMPKMTRTTCRGSTSSPRG